MSITPSYIPSPDQADADAQTRATALGVGVAPRDVPPCYAPCVTTLPGVVAEYGQMNVVYLADAGTTTAAEVTAAIAPLVAQEQADIAAQEQAVQYAQLQAQALAQFLGLLPDLGPALQQAQTDAANYFTASVADQASIVVRLIGNVAMLAEACSYAFTHLGLIPSGS